MYEVTTDAESVEQVEALPAAARVWFAELRAALEVAPWNGEPYGPPDDGMRTWVFGPHSEGFAVYLIVEHRRRVDLLVVTWIG